jgi:hypothetical protein
MTKAPTRKVAAGFMSAVLAAAGVSGATLSQSASAAPATHVLRLVSFQTGSVTVGRNGFVAGDKDLRRSNSQLVGFDAVTGRIKAGVARFDVSVALKGGTIIFHARQRLSATRFSGAITGGRGRFTGVRGTVTGHSPSKGSSTTYVTLTYHF